MTHSNITEKAANNVGGFSPKKIAQLRKAVRAPDWDETDLVFTPLPHLRPNAKYRADHHCDRGPGVTHQAAFKATAQYIAQQTQIAINAAKIGNAANDALATQALGRALHALQDCKSHSNYVDLAAADQLAFEAALLDPTKNPPDTVKITAYDPKAADPEWPIDPATGQVDAYSHGGFAKDSAHHNPESEIQITCAVCGVVFGTKFELAEAAAIEESMDLLTLVQSNLTNPQWQRLLTMVVEPDPFDSEYAFHCVGSGSVNCGGTTVLTVPGTLPDNEQVEALGVPLSSFGPYGDVPVLEDGTVLLVHREIRPIDQSLALPATIEIGLLPGELSGLVPDSLRVYRWNSVTEEWSPIGDAAFAPGNASVTFTSLILGNFAVGGDPLPIGGVVEVQRLAPYSAPAPSDSSPFAAAAGVAASTVAITAAGWYVHWRWVQGNAHR